MHPFSVKIVSLVVYVQFARVIRRSLRLEETFLFSVEAVGQFFPDAGVYGRFVQERQLL